MSESLGLSIGVANLVAARAGSAPVTRSSVLTLFDGRASEVGLPEENPNLTEPGLVMRGFVERVGDRAPLVAADGTKYLSDALMVEALEAMARTVGHGSPVAVAVPAYWTEAQSTALRNEFSAQPGLAADGVAPVLISDATAALAALQAKPGFPKDGFVALCDFGAGGTTVTLANAGSNFRQVGQSVRYTDFSGEAIDQLVADYVHSGGQDAATRAIPAATAPTGSVARLLGECRRAKEQLSSGTVTTIASGSDADFRLSRTDFEQLISGPLNRFATTLEEILQRNGIPRANLAGVATVGGGASIPLVTTRLSERLQVPVFTAPEPVLSAAVGAAVLGPLQSSASAATTAGAVAELPTEIVAAAPPTRDAGDSATYALAWSQDTATGQEPVPYTGPEHTGGYGLAPTGQDIPAKDRPTAEPGPLPWYKRTALVVSVAAALAAVLLAVVLALTVGHDQTKPGNTPKPNEPTQPPQTSETVATTGPNGVVTTTVIPPPPPSSSTQQPSTTQSPTTTTTTQPPTTTTTTAQPSSTTTAAPSSSTPQTTAASTPSSRRPPFGPPLGR